MGSGKFFFSKGWDKKNKLLGQNIFFVYTFQLDIHVSVRYALFVYTFRLDRHVSVRYTLYVYTFLLGIHISYTRFG